MTRASRRQPGEGVVMEVIHERCAGLDVHKETVVGCVRVSERGEVHHEVRSSVRSTRIAIWMNSPPGPISFSSQGRLTRPSPQDHQQICVSSRAKFFCGLQPTSCGNHMMPRLLRMKSIVFVC